MTTTIPDWWLTLSGVFFALFILLLIGLIVAAFYLIAAIKDVSTKIHGLTQRADEIGKNVQELISEVKSTTGRVGGQTSNLLSTVNAISGRVAQKVEWVSLGLMALSFVRGLRRRR